MSIRKHAFPALSALVLALVTAGCGKDSTGPGLTGDFTGNVSGEQTKSLRGDAFFGLGGNLGEDAGFAIVLLEGSALGDNDDFIVIGRQQTGRPGVGTYEIADGETTPTSDKFVAAWFPATGETVDGSFTSTGGGSITITTSTSRRLKGTFEFDAIGFYDEQPDTFYDVTVAGSFDAVFIDENGPATRVTSVRIRRAAAR